jgi:hypothetical protein
LCLHSKKFFECVTTTARLVCAEDLVLQANLAANRATDTKEALEEPPKNACQRATASYTCFFLPETHQTQMRGKQAVRAGGLCSTSKVTKNLQRDPVKGNSITAVFFIPLEVVPNAMMYSRERLWTLKAKASGKTSVMECPPSHRR